MSIKWRFDDADAVHILIVSLHLTHRPPGHCLWRSAWIPQTTADYCRLTADETDNVLLTSTSVCR